MSKDDELFALAKEVHDSNAIKYEGRIETLLANYYVFNRNYEELKKLTETKNYPQKMFELWDLRNRRQLEVVINEVLRLFQNFLASAKSLVDQTRVVIRAWYKDTDFLQEYNSEIKSRFTNNSLTGFIEDLRNYSLHYSLPITNATFIIQTNKETGTSTIDFSFVLIKSGLITWKEWGKGKTFLSESGNQIDINDLAEEYYKQIANFHSWLVKRLQEIHKDDLEWLENMRQKTINAMSDEERKDRGLM